MTPSFRRSASAVDRSWSEPLGIAVVRRSTPDISGDVEDLAIDPEMIVGIDELPGSRRTVSAAGSAVIPRPPIAAFRGPPQPSFLDIPLGRPGSFGPAMATGTGTAPSLASRRRTATVGHGHDSTSIVSPLPPPARSRTHGAVPGAPEPRRQIPRSWITIGTSAVATGVAIAIVMAMVSSRAPAIAPSQVTPAAVASATIAPSPPAATAPAKQTTGKPRLRPRVAAKLDAKPAPPATKPTNLHARSVAPAATQPVPAVARARATPPSAKTAAPASKPPTKIDAKAVAQAAKKPAATRPAKPVPKTATPAKRKTVASVEPKPVATKKQPATR